MKHPLAALILYGVLFASNFAYTQESEDNLIASLKGVDAAQAMKMANDWRWSHQKVKSFVTTQEVVFKFSNGVVKKIGLPEKKMIVAIAPFINQTHR